MLCAVHAELTLLLTNKAIMALAAFEEIDVLMLEIHQQHECIRSVPRWLTLLTSLLVLSLFFKVVTKET